MIYFDNSATTPINPSVLDTYVKTAQRIIGNPSSLHSLGTQANRLLQQSRKQVADLLNVTPEEVFFTSSGTEGNNWVIKGTAFEKHYFGKHIIISAVEHSAVSAAVRQLETLGFEVSIAPVNRQGFIDVQQLKELIRQDTILISTMVVNNEIGSFQPIKEISAYLEEYPKIHFHVDAVQTLGKISIENWLTDRVDFATFSAHKFHGPRGVGFVFWRKGRKIAPLLNGGGQEFGQRSSTENLPAIAAMSKAMRLQLTDEELKQQHQRNLQKYMIQSLSQFEKVQLFTEANESFAPHIVCFGVKGIKGEVLVHAFEDKDIFISTTSACSSRGSAEDSTLASMNVPANISTTAVRVSFSEQSTMTEVEQFLIVFKQLYEKFSKITR